MVRTLFISLLCTLFLFNTAFSEEKESKGESKKILLVYEKTKFKEALIEKMESLLKEKEYEVAKVLHGKKDPIENNVDDFEAVFIVNSGVNSKVRPWIKTWLDSNEEHGSKIFVHTTQKNDKGAWTPKIKVDGITSASNTKKVDEFAKSNVDKLLEIVNKSEE